MDLKLQDVSELLNVPEQILLEWVSTGKIPAYKIRDAYRFNRQEIENWLLQKQNKINTAIPSKKKGQDHFNLYRAIHNGDILLDIQGRTKEAIFSQVAVKIAPKLKLDKDVLTEHLLERENLAPTALGQGFAIPHTKDFLLCSSQDIVTVVFLHTPIEYGALDKLPVHTFFFLLACDDRRHLALLSKIAYLVQSPTMQKILAQHPSKKKLLPVIKDWEVNLLF